MSLGRTRRAASTLSCSLALLRSLAIIYLIAFISLWTQIIGLVGQNGILPAKSTMETLQQQATAANVGLERYHLFPTLCWF